VEVAGGTAPLLEIIYESARRRGMRFIPVAWAGESTKAHLKLVADAAALDGHGVGIRYRILGVALPPTVGQADFLGRMLDIVGVDATDADLLIDLDYLDPDVELDVDDMADIVGELEEAAPWRSVVLLGTSIPSMMSCVPEGTVGRLPRKEWELWGELADAGLPRAPAFGDYAVQHPRPPQDGGGPGMRANVRYTTDKGTLVARGQGSVIQEGKEQYQDLCAQLVRTPEFAGGAYSWGDGVIRDCASGAIEPGAQNVWRGAGTSHHLQLVTDQLRQREAQA
jgi:hypothetical protein